MWHKKFDSFISVSFDECFFNMRREMRAETIVVLHGRSCHLWPFYLKLEYVDVFQGTSLISCLMNVHSVVFGLLHGDRRRDRPT
jgi:hypothetical protein